MEGGPRGVTVATVEEPRPGLARWDLQQGWQVSQRAPRGLRLEAGEDLRVPYVAWGVWASGRW